MNRTLAEVFMSEPTTWPVFSTAREGVAWFRNADPTMSQAEMARRLDVSRQRVQQLLIELGLPLVYRPARSLTK